MAETVNIIQRFQTWECAMWSYPGYDEVQYIHTFTILINKKILRTEIDGPRMMIKMFRAFVFEFTKIKRL